MGDLFLEIITPFGIIYEGAVKNCSIPGVVAPFQVLKNHAPMIALIEIGVIKVEDLSGREFFLASAGGICEIDQNTIRLIVESAEMSDTIDVLRAKEAKERAEKRIKSKDTDVDIDRARLALLRAINRLKVSRQYK